MLSIPGVDGLYGKLFVIITMYGDILMVASFCHVAILLRTALLMLEFSFLLH